MKVKITNVANFDAYYHDKKLLVGSVGEFTPDEPQRIGWESGGFESDEPIIWYDGDTASHFYFAGVRFKEVK